MHEVIINFKNYKKLKEGSYDLSNGTVFILQGPNEAGKTSFLNLLKSIMEAKDETANPVSFGEKDGFVTGVIPGADGRPYQFRYDFNVDGKSKFQFIDPDNKIIKTVGEMRNIFQYNHFTVEQFFDWSKSVPGRRKQREIFMELLSESERKMINDIDASVNTTNGTLVEKRKVLNEEVSFLKKSLDAAVSQITEEDRNLLKVKVDVEKLFDELTNKKSEIDELLEATAGVTEKIATLNELHEANLKAVDERLTNSNTTIQSYEEQIAELTRKLEKERKNNNAIVVEKETMLETYQTKYDALSKNYDEKYISELNEKLSVINTRLEAGIKKKTRLIELEAITKVNEKNKTDYDTKVKEVNELDEKIKTLREKKTEIITNSQSIPDGWTLGDDSVVIDGIPFLETDISKSRAVKAVAALMMKVNKAPIMLMGDAESLGYEALDDIQRFAEENNKIMVFAEHSRDVEDIQLVCYDMLEKKQPKSKEIF